MPSGSGAFEAMMCSAPSLCGIQRISEPSGFVLLGNSSNVVPTTRNFPSGESTAIVGPRLVQSVVFTEYCSGRAVSLPLASTDISRRWSGPNVCSTYSVRLDGAYASDLAPPLVAFPVRLVSTSARSPSSSLTATLETELSPALMASSVNDSLNFRFVAPLCEVKERFMGPARLRLPPPSRSQTASRKPPGHARRHRWGESEPPQPLRTVVRGGDAGHLLQRAIRFR